MSIFGTLAALALAAQPQQCTVTGPYGTPGSYKSVEQLSDGRVTFRLCAPDAPSVVVDSYDLADAMPAGGPNQIALTRDESGLWSGTTPRAAAPGTYRYNFHVAGSRVPDPQATEFAGERVGIQSLVSLSGPGGEFQSYDKAVPHGAVSEVEYWSGSLGQKRRAHVYTPPGYMKDAKRYPVLYLVHGAGDDDSAWSTVGRANYIIDNLIATGKAVPMIVVMPAGHTPERANGNFLENGDFGSDLIEDLIPYVDAQYRTIAEADHRAMAGLSMGGAHTLQYGLTHPELFHYAGIFSMGLGFRDPTQVARYERDNAKALARTAKDMKLVYWAMGKTDFLYPTVAPTRALFDRAGLDYVYNESEGGHTWANWRDYLADFAPRLFK